jgi:hypothetical protein
MTVPSTGIRSPGRTITISPDLTSPSGFSIQLFARSTRAVGGKSVTSFLRAADVFRLALASIARPARTNPMITMTAS